MMGRFVLKSYLFAIGALVLCCSIVYAAEFDLEVNTGATYDTNFLRIDPSDRNDAYFTLSPRAALKMPANKAYSSFGVRGVWEEHLVKTSQDLQELVIAGLGRYNPSYNISLSMRDEIILSGRLRSIVGRDDDLVSDNITIEGLDSDAPPEGRSDEVFRKREFADNRFLAAMRYEYKGGEQAVSLEYTNIIRDYRDTETDDWVANAGLLTIEDPLGHRTSTSLNLGLIRKSYQVGMNYVSIPASVSLERQLGNKFKSAISLGVEGRRYSEEFDEEKYRTTPTAGLKITGQFAPKATSWLRVQRTFFDSDMWTGDAFVSNAFDMSVILALTDAVRFTLEGLYSRNDYVTRDSQRDDDFFLGYAEVRYINSTLGSISLRYGYERRNSDIVHDYVEHTIELYHLRRLTF
ncbi:hypothetical protein ACFL6S_17075 [Candidatus Poribacteria bacterium]